MVHSRKTELCWWVQKALVCWCTSNVDVIQSLWYGCFHLTLTKDGFCFPGVALSVEKLGFLASLVGSNWLHSQVEIQSKRFQNSLNQFWSPFRILVTFFAQFWFELIDNFSLPSPDESDSRTVSLICSFVLLPLLVLYRINLPFISPAYLAWNRSPKVNLNPWPCLDIWIAQMRNDCKMD